MHHVHDKTPKVLRNFVIKTNPPSQETRPALKKTKKTSQSVDVAVPAD